MHIPQIEIDQNGMKCGVTVSSSHLYPVPLPRYPFLRYLSRKYVHTHTNTHSHSRKFMDFFHFKVCFLSSTVYCRQVTRKSHIVRGGYGSVLSQIQTPQLVSLTTASLFQSTWMCCQNHFPKILLPLMPLPEFMMFPRVYSKNFSA